MLSGLGQDLQFRPIRVVGKRSHFGVHNLHVSGCHTRLGGSPWSVQDFDEKMENLCAKSRAKKRKALERQRPADTTPVKKQSKGSSKSEEQDVETRGGDDDDVPISKFRNGAPITFIDGADASVAHGIIIDDEPDVDMLADTEYLTAESLQPGAWKMVKMSIFNHGYSTFAYQPDWIFTDEGDVFNTEDRKVSSLMHLDKFIIYYQAIVPRRSSVAKAKPRRKKDAKEKHKKHKSNKYFFFFFFEKC